MKHIAIGVAALATGLLLAVSASAVDIQNDDDDDYQLTITNMEGAPSQVLTLRAATTLTRICEGPCTLRVEGVGEVEADEQELVLIQDGEILKQPKEN